MATALTGVPARMAAGLRRTARRGSEARGPAAARAPPRSLGRGVAGRGPRRPRRHRPI